MSRSMLDSTAGGTFMSKTIPDAKVILENILLKHSQWHNEIAPNPSRKVNSIGEVYSLVVKVNTMLSYI
jgi:hypothetical protein